MPYAPHFLPETDERLSQEQLRRPNFPTREAQSTHVIAVGFEVFAQAVARSQREAVAQNPHARLVVQVGDDFRACCSCGWFSIGSATYADAFETVCERWLLERVFARRLVRDGAAVIDALRDTALSVARSFTPDTPEGVRRHE